MKKRLFSLLLCLAMLCGMMSISTYAAEQITVTEYTRSASYNNADTLAAAIPEVAGKVNLLDGLPAKRPDGSVYKNDGTDGSYARATDCNSTTHLQVHYSTSNSSYAVLYDLGVQAQLDGFLVGSNTSLKTSNSIPHWLRGYSVYVSDDHIAPTSREDFTLLTQVEDDGSIDAATATYTRYFSLSEAVTARYVLFYFSTQDRWGNALIAQLGVYGTKPEYTITPYGNTASFTDAAGMAAAIPEIADLENLLITSTPYTSFGDEFVPSSANQGFAQAIDCNNGAESHLLMPNPRTMLFKLSSIQYVDTFLVGSNSRLGLSNGIPFWLRNYNIYVSTNPSGTAWQKVATVIDDGVRDKTKAAYTNVITLDKAVPARYVIVEFKSMDVYSNALVGEVGAYCASPQNRIEDVTPIRAVGAAIRDPGQEDALRFGMQIEGDFTDFRLTENGYTAALDADGNYQGGYVLAQGRYSRLLRAGALVTPANTLDGEQVPTVQELVDSGCARDVFAANIYAVSGGRDTLTYTVAVTNIPYRYHAMAIVVCPYVVVEGENGETVTVYGDILVRSWEQIYLQTEQQEGNGGYFAPNSRVVFTGDSITHESHHIKQIFAYYATKYLADKVEMYTTGIQGGEAETQLVFLEEDVMAYDPDYVVIMFGMNDVKRELYLNTDFFRPNQLEAIQKCADDIETLICRLQSRGIRVLLCTPSTYDQTVQVEKETWYNCIGSREGLQELSERIERLGWKYGCKVVDFNTPTMEATDYVQDEGNAVAVGGVTYTGSDTYTIINSDRIHPRTVGSDLMARVFLRDIGEPVSLPTMDSILSCCAGAATPDYTFIGDGMNTSAKATLVNQALSFAQNNVRPYWLIEYYSVGYDNHRTMTREEKITYVASKSPSQSWFATYHNNYANLANNLETNVATYIAKTGAVYP